MSAARAKPIFLQNDVILSFRLGALLRLGAEKRNMREFTV